jgi:hypothetical protein
MTKKYYIKLAKQLIDRRLTIDPKSQWVKEDIAFNRGMDAAIAEIADILKQDRSEFDTNRFLSASGVQP